MITTKANMFNLISVIFFSICFILIHLTPMEGVNNFYFPEEMFPDKCFIKEKQNVLNDTDLELNSNILGSLLNYYSDYGLGFNLGNFVLYHKLPKSFQDSLKILKGASLPSVGLFWELDTNFGKIGTQLEGNDKFNSFKISNDVGILSFYYLLNNNSLTIGDLEKIIGFGLNLHF